MDRAQPKARLQPMDVTSLKAVLGEWRRHLLPSRFEKAQQATPHSIQIGLRSLEGIHWLELSWQAEAARVHSVAAPPRLGDGSTLAQQLQHSLRGLALGSISQAGWERVVELGFSRRPGEAIERTLVVELMGRHSNLLLLDQTRQAIALARQVKPQQSRLRPIGTGDTYQPPPPLAGEPPHGSETMASWQRRLSLLPLPLGPALASAYQGMSPALIQQLLPDDWQGLGVEELEANQWHQLWERWQGWLGCVEAEGFAWQQNGDGYRCWPALSSPQAPPLAINQAMAAYYGNHLDQQRLAQRRHQLGQTLQRAAEREAREAQAQQALLEAVPESDTMQQQADALLSQRQPSRQCVDTAQKLYKRARKLRRSVAAITPRLELHHQRLAALENSLTFLEQASTIPEIEGLQQELQGLLGSGGKAKALPGRRDRKLGEPAQPEPLQVQSLGGLAVQVGRNHRQNEWISFKQARRGDLWFHAQELPGSHVVLKASEGMASDEDLQTAADLAAHFSRGRGNSRVPVVMVPIEALQRIPGAAPGTVRHRQAEQLWGEPGRALSLLAAQKP
jgi:predicted ribosome quality control (RQC) complex YloA/Tae2 family protein